MPKAANSISPTNLLAFVIIIGYLSIGFIPNLQAVDKIAPQWLGMTILNLTSLFVIYNNRKSFKSIINKVLSNYLSLFYIGFILWAALSYFYAINPTEVIVNITRQVNVLLMVLFMGILLFRIFSSS